MTHRRQLHTYRSFPTAYRRRRFSRGRLGLAAALLSALSIVSGPLAAHAEERPDPLPVNPFEAPSAAGERLLLERAGLLARRAPAPAPQSSVASSQASGQPGVDVITNNPGDDAGDNTTQSETTLAVLGDTLCAGYNNSGPGGLSGLSRSPDLGETWADLGGLGQSGDPVIVVHEATGTFYYAEIATINGNPAIGVARSNDDCMTFGAAIDAGPGASALATTTLNDKPWIAVDNTGGANDGNVYVCWTRFIDTDADGQANTSELRFSRSIDGGATYVNEQIIQAAGTAPFGCSVGVGPNGEVHVAWADRFGGTQDNIRFRSSGDAGQNFSAAVNVSTGNRHPGTDTITNCGPNNMRPTLTGQIRMLHQAWLAVDATGGPFDGNIYVVWASDPAGTPDNSDVFFSRSTDGGVMWSAPVQVGDGGGATDQFEPFVAVGGAGAVSIAWYDRRNDGTNNMLIDVYKTFSQDGGATLDPIIRVTDTNFGVPQINPNFDPGITNCYMGEYIAVTADARNFYYLWGDNRNTIVTTNFPGGRLDPDVFFEFEVGPVVNTADLEIVDKTDDPDPVKAGKELIYEITVRNNGPDIALDVTVTDQLPAGVTYVSDTDACLEGPPGLLTCSLGDLIAGETRVFTITVTVAPGLVTPPALSTVITNTATVAGIAVDPNPENNTASEDTTVLARLNHFMCYELRRQPAFTELTEVSLDDQFGLSTVSVGERKRLCNPADKNDEDPTAPTDPEHLTSYAIRQHGALFEPRLGVGIVNQFGGIVLDVGRPERILVPTAKDVTAPPPPLVDPLLDHFKCYRVRHARTRVADLKVDDQFGTLTVDVKRPRHLCVPADKNGEGILDSTADLMCYKSKTRPARQLAGAPFGITNQFEQETVVVSGPREICVPSVKVECCGPTDRCIDTDGTASPGDGIPGAVDVPRGAALASFPVAGVADAGLDWFDNDHDGQWTLGPFGDDLHSEDPTTCPTADRNGFHDLGADCKVLDQDGTLFDGQSVDCDLEVNVAFSEPHVSNLGCPSTLNNIRYHDANGDGSWDDGEDIVLDVNGNEICD